MFQAPQTSTHFSSSAQVAVLRAPARTKSRRTSKPDPIIDLLRQLETARRRYVAARKAQARIERENDKTLWQEAGVGPGGSDLMIIGGFNDRWFTSSRAIDRWARERIAVATDEAGKSHNAGKMHAARRIRRVKALRPILKKELLKRQAVVAKSRKAIGWDVAAAEHREANNAFWKIRQRVADNRPKTMKGVHALVSYLRKGIWQARHSEETKFVPGWTAESVLENLEVALQRLTPEATR